MELFGGLSMTSRYELDSQEISKIQFHSNLPQVEKNKLMRKIEKRMEIEEQKELDGKGSGYYE